MRVALTGASGFIGAAICRELARDGHRITALVRETSRRDHIEGYVERFVVGDHAEPALWPALLDGADSVVHNSLDWSPLSEPGAFEKALRSNLVGSIQLLEASRPLPFVFMSSIAVHHDMRPRWGGIIDEDHPLRPANDYGACKAGVEAYLWAEHFTHSRHVTAIRPCAVYGIDPKLDRSHGYALLRKVSERRPVHKPGGGKFVHVDDVARATVGALDAAPPGPGVVNLVDCYARWADWARMACDILGVTVEIDTASPSEPANVFAKDRAVSLGVSLDRGHDGIRDHLRRLAGMMGVVG